MSAGYSKTPLIKKLGIKPGFQIAIIHPPKNYFEILGDLPETVTIIDNSADAEKSLDFVHAFYRERAGFEAEFETLKTAIKYNGMVWISWLKKSSKIPTDLSDSIIRNYGLQCGLVDVKVAAIDNHWSGLKFMYRKEDRL